MPTVGNQDREQAASLQQVGWAGLMRVNVEWGTWGTWVCGRWVGAPKLLEDRAKLGCHRCWKPAEWGQRDRE